MSCEPTVDHGQQLAPPAGKVIGFFDDKAEFEGFAEALRAAGYPAANITSLYGEDGIHLLERLKDRGVGCYNKFVTRSARPFSPPRTTRK